MRLVRTALAIGLLSTAGPAFTASVTVHSDGVTGNYSTIGQALAAVQGESPGPNNPDVITILDKGPFREGTLNIIGDAHANSITIRAAEGVRPILVSTSTGSNAIVIRKNGRAEIRDLIIIPASNINQTALRAILYERTATNSTGYDYHLENILISSNNGKDRPVAAYDGLGNPAFDPAHHKSFRGDGGIRGNSTDESQVYRMTMRGVVVSCLNSPAPYGLRSFQDGAAGSELIIGEGCVFSRISSSTADGAAINLGGMEGTPNIGRIQGSEENPVLIVSNGVRGLFFTGVNEESNLISDLIIVGNKDDAVFLANPLMNSTFRNVTIAGNSRHALRLAQNDGTALNYAGTFSATNSIFGGNGSVVVSNAIRGVLAAAGSLVFEDSALVTMGPNRLNQFYPNGMEIGGTGTVTLTRVVNADPKFVSLGTFSPAFATVTAPAYAEAGPDGEPLRGGGSYQGSPASGVAWYFYN